MISMTRIVDNWDFLLSVIWDIGKLYENNDSEIFNAQLVYLETTDLFCESI